MMSLKKGLETIINKITKVMRKIKFRETTKLFGEGGEVIDLKLAIVQLLHFSPKFALAS